LCFRPERKLAGSGSHRRINRAWQGTHNNTAENAIRPLVVGRKNWLFAGRPKGAETSALLYSRIETAKANGREPWAYLHYLFEHLPTAKSPEAVAAPLPHILTLHDLRPDGAIP
jgi:hypothetical protein